MAFFQKKEAPEGRSFRKVYKQRPAQRLDKFFKSLTILAMLAGQFSQTDRRILGLLSVLLAAGVVLNLYKKNSQPVSPSFRISAMEVPPSNFVKSPKKSQNPAFAPIDLNRAGREELEKLPGFGPALAERILEFREKNGKFKTVQELLRVPGIGPKKLARIKSKVYVSQGVVGPPAGVWSRGNPQNPAGALPKAPKESSMVSSQAGLR